MALDQALEAQSTTPTQLSVSYRPISATYLRARREKLLMSQRDLAALVGITHTGIHRIEKQLSKASPWVAEAIAKALREPLEELFVAVPKGQRGHD